MFAYCENDPIAQSDPTGEFNLWGFVLGLAEVAVGIAIAPLDGGATFYTGCVTTVAAATEEVMVIDASVSYCGNKEGACVVIDFGNNTYDTYMHYGTYAGTDLSPTFTYSVGFVGNYNQIGDYGGHFIEGDVSVGPLGLSSCGDPDNPNGAYASCITVSTSISPISASVGYDTYVPTGGSRMNESATAVAKKIMNGFGTRPTPAKTKGYGRVSLIA